jgi:hypothetical protein
VWARWAHLHAHRALAPGLDGGGGGLAQQGDVAGEQLGMRREERAEPVVLGRHLLGHVEDVGDVDGGFGDGPSQLEHHGEAALHVRRAESPQRVALDPRHLVAVGRDGVGVPGQHKARGAAGVGAPDHVVVDPGDLEAGHGPQTGLDVVGDRRLVEARRGDVDQLGRAGEEVGHQPLRRSRRDHAASG